MSELVSPTQSKDAASQAFEKHPLAAWPEVEFEALVTETQLGTPERGSDDDGKNIGLVKMGNLTWGNVALKELELIAARKIKENDPLLKEGDIIFNTRNSSDLVGKSAVWKAAYGKATFDNNINRIRLSNLAEPDFYGLYLNTGVGKKNIQSLAVGSTSVAAIYWKDLKRLRVPLPPRSEQRKISEILSTWDEAIEKLEALKASKENRQRALTRALVFGALRLNGSRQTDQVVPHRWFTLPADWSCKPIGNVAVEVSERQGNAVAAEVLSCSKYDGFVRSLEYFKKQVFSADLANYKRIWRNDFGFPSNHVEEGSIGLQDLVEVGVVSPIYTVFRFAADKVDPRYAYAVLKTRLYRHIFEVSTSASVDRRGSLRWGEFSQLPFPLPSLPEQRAIVEVLQTANADIAGLSAEIETLTRQKRGLMQKLLTGEWRVKLDRNEGVAA